MMKTIDGMIWPEPALGAESGTPQEWIEENGDRCPQCLAEYTYPQDEDYGWFEDGVYVSMECGICFTKWQAFFRADRPYFEEENFSFQEALRN
jgi:hypothetical protein